MDSKQVTAKPGNPQSTIILKWVIIAGLGLAALIVTFGFGVWVGQERAEFSFHWAEYYHRNFAGPAAGLFGNFPAGSFIISSHGVYGQIMQVDSNSVTIKDQDGTEQTIITDSNTTIAEKGSIIKFSDLKMGESIAVIGEPDAQGQIQAKFIRVLPSVTATSLYYFGCFPGFIDNSI